MTHQICDACECVSLCSKSGCRPLVPMDQAPKFAIPPSSDVATLQRELNYVIEMLVKARSQNKQLVAALVTAEAALADVGDADREPGDDVAWCEARTAQALPTVRLALQRHRDELPF